MNKFDEFIEKNDQALQVDTSSTRALSRESTLTNTPSVTIGSPTLSKSHQPQLTPSRPSEQDHPLLKETTPTGKFARANSLSKRRSLIKPLISSESAPYAVSETPTNSGRLRSASNASTHSRVSSVHSLEDQNDVSTLLQLLANKELEILEGKKRIDDLKTQLLSEEQSLLLQQRQLQALKDQVAKSFNPTNPASNPHNAIKSVEQQMQLSNTTTPTKKHESMWSKPLSLFNQFDQIIQHELEKKLAWDDFISSPEGTPRQEQRPTFDRQPQQQQQPQQRSANRALASNRNMKNSDSLTSTSRMSAPRNEDVISNVSSSLWSFVSDVKSGLLGINEEPEPQETGKKQPTIPGIKQFKTTAHDVNDQKEKGDNNLKFVPSVEEPQKAIRRRRSSVVEMQDYLEHY